MNTLHIIFIIFSLFIFTIFIIMGVFERIRAKSGAKARIFEAFYYLFDLGKLIGCIYLMIFIFLSMGWVIDITEDALCYVSQGIFFIRTIPTVYFISGLVLSGWLFHKTILKLLPMSFKNLKVMPEKKQDKGGKQ